MPITHPEPTIMIPVSLLPCRFRAPLPFIASTLVCLAFATPVSAADLSLKVNKIVQAEGELQIAVYSSEATFRKTSVHSLRHPVTAPGEVSLVIKDLPAGEYAVMVFHDLNGNRTLDTNLFGVPKEPWGGSFGGKRVFGAPGWQDVRFSLGEPGETVSIDLE